jgi:hypothetical protein
MKLSKALDLIELKPKTKGCWKVKFNPHVSKHTQKKLESIVLRYKLVMRGLP